ncbi:MAG: hypothetical protein ACJ710_10380 [Ornithinibacter sp.]
MTRQRRLSTAPVVDVVAVVLVLVSILPVRLAQRHAHACALRQNLLSAAATRPASRTPAPDPAGSGPGRPALAPGRGNIDQ